MRSLKRVFVPIVGVLLLCCEQIAGEFVKLCTTEASRIIPVTFDHEIGEFVQVTDENRGGNSNIDDGTRFLRSEVVPSISVSERRRIQQNTANKTVFYVRKCLCPSRPWDSEFTAYCPIDKTTCGIPRNLENEPVACFNQSSRTSLIRNAWPVIVLWYGGLCIFLLFTTQGRNTRHFIVSKCCNRNLNNTLIDTEWFVDGGFWRRRRRRTRTMPSLLEDVRQRSRERRQQEVPPLPPNTLDHLASPPEEAEQHPPNQLALKTKRYVAPEDTQDEDDTSCTICFSPLENGDRVGALPCNHTFHVDCLKEWLRVRNVCPLCQSENVAVPQYQPRAEQDEENSLVQEQSDENGAPQQPGTQQGVNENDEPNQPAAQNQLPPQRLPLFRVNRNRRRMRRR